MPRIPNEWLGSVVYIYQDEDDARAGARTGASGFLGAVNVTAEDLPSGLAHLYVVTNHHAVVARASVALRVNRKAGGFDVLTIPASDWLEHPAGDDLAVAPISEITDSTHRYATINTEMMLSSDLQEKWEFDAGDEVFFIGRYVDLEGKAHNVPVARSGILAARLAEPIWQELRAHRQDTILVEARSLSGFSGSPVFVTPAPYIEKGSESGVPVVRLVEGGPVYLLGIDYGHHPWREFVRDPSDDDRPLPERHFVRTNSGMMMVVPASKLLELLHDEDLVMRRRKVEDEFRDRHVE